MKQRPSHQWYMQDFLSSYDVQTMNIEEVGCYCLLLFNLYVNGGQIENDKDSLAMLCRGIKPSEKVMKKFYEKDGFLKNKRVDDEMRKQAKFSKTQSENAKKRWGQATNKDKPSQCHRIKSASIRQCSSTSTSTSNNKEKNIIKKENIIKFFDSIKTKNEEYLNLVCAISEKKEMDKKEVAAVIEDFYFYWTETNASGAKQRWQLQKTFDVMGRIRTFFLNKDKFFKGNPRKREIIT